MEDYYKKYIEKAQYINQACDCIDENSSSKLNDEISEIKNVISKLSIDDYWQDKAGSAFKKMIKNCIKNLEKIETSISTDFSNSEKIYKSLKLKLDELKETNISYNNYSREPIQSSYKKRVATTVDGKATEVYVDDVDTFNNEHAKWQDLKTKCIDLSEEIDSFFKQLDDINENGNIFMIDTLFKFDVSVKRFTDSVGKGGNFVSNNLDNTKQGFFVSDKDGRKYTIYDQTKIDGWGGFCNRAAAASIASGFALNGQNPITVANDISSDKNYKSELGYNQKTTSAYFEKFGLSATVNKVDCSYDLVKDKILTALKNGDKVMFDLSEKKVVGNSGQQWTSDRHWLTVLDYKKIGPGENDYAIFISDSSGRGGSTTDRGLGAGWYKLDEFSGQTVANVTTVQQKNNASTASTQATPSTKLTSDQVKFTVEIPDSVSQMSHHTVTCYEKDGWHYNASKTGTRVGVGTGQKLVHDVWNSQGSTYENGVAIIDDNGTRILVACTEKIGKVGDRITINYENGQKVEALVADQKDSKDSTYTEFGHKDGNQTSIIELEVNTQDYREKQNPSTKTWGLSWDTSSNITSIDNYGSAKDDLAVKV